MERIAEKEFETQFTAICTITQKAIKLRKSVMLNSPFLKKLVEKYREHFELVEDDVIENSGSIASRVNVQIGDSEVKQPVTKSADANTAQPNRANGGN